MILCTAEACRYNTGIFGEVVQGNTETVDTLAVEDTLKTGLLPGGKFTEESFAAEGSHTEVIDGITTIIYTDGYLIKLN